MSTVVLTKPSIIIIVTGKNIDQFTKNPRVRELVLRHIANGDTIGVSDHGMVGQYVCSCTCGEFDTFQRIKGTDLVLYEKSTTFAVVRQ